jgi:hypothetical protein
VTAFKREVRCDHIVTYLIAADDSASLNQKPLLSRAADFVRSGIATRKPAPISCRASFAEDSKEAAEPGFAAPK